MKVLSKIVITILCLVLAGLGFIYLAPGYNLYLVRSESMKPNINMGDLIITGPINGEIKNGTVVTYMHNKSLITHRVQGIDGNTIITKGDALEDPDQWKVALSDVKGVYLFKIPYVGFVLNFIRTKLGWFLVIIIPAVALIGWLIRDILKEAFSDVEETSDTKGGEAYHQTKEDTKDTSRLLREILMEAFNDAQVKMEQKRNEDYHQTVGNIMLGG